MEVLTLPKEPNNSSLKESAILRIINILISEYGLSRQQAIQTIKSSKIEAIFDRNAEIAAHTSYKTWAKRAYEHTINQKRPYKFIKCRSKKSPTFGSISFPQKTVLFHKRKGSNKVRATKKEQDV